jgi:serpin B
MSYVGARGDTEKQMAAVLHLNSKQQEVHTGFGELQQRLNDTKRQTGIELDVANGLWAQQGHTFLPEFLNFATRQYQAELRQVDFKTQAEAAAEEINGWVSKQTRDRIQNILPPGALGTDTRLVLAGAIYFKGRWAEPFIKGRTIPKPFHLSFTDRVDVPMMSHDDEVRYAESDSFQAVELPYKGDLLSMVVLLPRQVDGLEKLEGLLTPAFVAKCFHRMKKREVEIHLPRFKLESGFELSKALVEMGMRDAFLMAKTDFSGIDGTKNLFVRSIYHKALGEVNEEGTEAAAATGLHVRQTSTEPEVPDRPVFRADHPFVFLICERQSGAILFLGRLMDPRGSEPG